MKQRSLFVFCLIFGITGFVTAQARLVTNASLEQYQQERLKAEQEYRENYARLGLPSPEEIDRRREQSRIETEQLAAKLRAESLEYARLEAQRRENARHATSYYGDTQVWYGAGWYYPNYIWSYVRRPKLPHVQPYSQPGYFAGGQFWPTGSRTTNTPIWHVPRPRR